VPIPNNRNNRQDRSPEHDEHKNSQQVSRFKKKTKNNVPIHMKPETLADVRESGQDLVKAKLPPSAGMRSRQTMPRQTKTPRSGHAKKSHIPVTSSLRVLTYHSKKSHHPWSSAASRARNRGDPYCWEGFAIQRLPLDAPRVSWGLSIPPYGVSPMSTGTVTVSFALVYRECAMKHGRAKC